MDNHIEMLQGIGIDIIEVRRMRQAVERWGDDFLKRIFTQEEIRLGRQRIGFYQYLAGRFAAKEAVFKALGDSQLGWKDIEIINDNNGKPICRMRRKKDIHLNVFISISHIKTYAVANAIITKK